MQYTTLGHSSLRVSRIGLGCMTMSDFYAEAATKSGRIGLEDQSMEAMQAAVHAGCNFFDTADMYGSGHNERLLDRFIEAYCASGGKREDLAIASKFLVQRDEDGNTIGRSGKPEYARQACLASLNRLGLEQIDLYYLHGPDPDTPIEISVEGMEALKQDGLIGALGISNVTPEQIRAAHGVHPISAVQNEYSLWRRMPEDGVLQTCAGLGITFVPYSPLARGFLTGAFPTPESMMDEDRRRQHPWFKPEDTARNAGILSRLEEVSARIGYSTVQTAIAWTIARGKQFGADVVPIPGAKSAAHVTQNCGASSADLTKEDVDYLSGD